MPRLAYQFELQLAGLINGNAGMVRIGTLGWVLLLFPIMPSILFAIFFNMERKNGGTVPGAADNLSACALAVAMCKFLVKSVVAAAERAQVPYKMNSASLGVRSDAGPFSRAGLKATTLLPFKVPQQMVAFYHQKWDRPEVLTIEPLINVPKLTLEWVRNGGEGEC